MNPKKWITFIGEGRSGHTIVSAILDSHPHIRISEEQKYISKWYREQWPRDRILKHLLASGLGKERKPKALPGALQYKDPLLLVGDKCGWDAVNEFRKRGAPVSIIEDFGNHMRMETKIIHTSRHPLNNIAAWMGSPKYKRKWPDDTYRCRMLIKRYSRFYTAAEELMKNKEVFHLRNESLCFDTKRVLESLCRFLEVEPEQTWLANSIRGAFSKPHVYSLDWPNGLDKMIQWRILDRYPSLKVY
jgi:hypothetical protein